ncbi:hypothetical protein E1301_Tti008759 [Triplophysa tibetana]|uniref:Uncharacterized protein n=1 Tax=Triplophysa tibetana TaxID=1572043 RepID=A0A5A9P008_9TELE|nr:hypothetical protein E1301_Tti008759 [Triplophysa tibetana]
MAENPEDPLALLEILEVLGACRQSVSYADICVYLSGRFSLQPLLELRSLLYSTACRDPCFPATLFRERLHPPCSNCLSAAADVVSLFNLLMHTHMAPTYTNVQSLTPCQVCGKGFVRYDWPAALPVTGGGSVSADCKYENLPCEAFSLNAEASRTQTASQLLAYPHSYVHVQGSMQDTHSVDASGDVLNQEAGKTSAANQEAHVARSCSQKRSAFKGGHKLVPLISVEHVGQSEQSPREDGEDVHYITQKNPYPDPATYANSHSLCVHDPSYIYASQSFDASTYSNASDAHNDTDASNPYSPDQIHWERKKHESLDELQTSTYFGPSVSVEKQQTPALHVKSHSLDIDSRTANERSEQEPSVLQKPKSERSVLEMSGLRKPGVFQLSFEGSSLDIPGFDPRIISSVRDTFKRLSGMSLDAWYDWSPTAEGVANAGTQTETTDRRALRSLMLSERLSIDNPDIGEDDISAIFRFLDDISMCGSMAVLPGEGGGGAQDGGGAGLPERRERLGKLRRLFHSMEAPEEGVRWGVGRLLQRVAELEQQLEPIAELREQLDRVLSTLDRLEQREPTVCLHPHQIQYLHPTPQTSIQSQGSPRVSLGTEGSDEAAVKRRRLFVRRASKAPTESSSCSEAHREWSISFTKEQQIQPSKSDQLSVVYKKEAPEYLMPPEAHRTSRRTSLQSTTQTSNDRPKVTWNQSDLTPLDLQAPESLEFWTDEIYTPASDTLLRRSHSYSRCNRNQAYRIAALSITATIILILIIVIPVSTA